jgi:co-chaperonin GroES (HSP10)
MIIATNNNYVVKPLGVNEDREEARDSGIIVKKTLQDSELGEIISAGNDIENPIAVGSKVVVAWNNAIPVFVNGDRKFIVDKAYVLGIVNDD